MTTTVHRTAIAATTSALLATGLAATAGEPASAAPPHIPAAVSAWRSSDLTANQWALDAIGAPRAGRTGDGSGITVAVIDTGADATHPDLAGVLVDGATVTSPDGTAIQVHPTRARDTVDKWGHGTHVSGIVAAKDDGHGTRGAAPGATLLPINLYEFFNTYRSPRGYADALIASMTYAATHGARVINMSLGDEEPDLPSSGTPEQDVVEFQRICTAITALKQRNVVTVVAAGNSGDSDNSASSPSTCADAVEVGATDVRTTNAWFSTYNAGVDITAPGHQILSTTPEGDYAMMSGTSMAAPYVSAAFADVFSAHPDWTAQDAITAIYAGAHDLGLPGTDVVYGHGLLDIAGALGEPATPVIVRDTFAPRPRWANTYAMEGIVGWNAPTTTNITGYTVSLLATASGTRTSYDLGADAVQMTSSAPMNGRWWVNVVAHRRVGGDLDGGWTYLPYLGDISPASRPSHLRAVPVRSTPAAVTFRLTWTKGADTDLASDVAFGFSTTRSGEGPELHSAADCTSALLTVPRALLAEDGTFYVRYPLGNENEPPPGTTLARPGDATAYVTSITPSRVRTVYQLDGTLNPSTAARLAPYAGKVVRVQIRNRVTKRAVSVTGTRLTLSQEPSTDSAGKDTVRNWYSFHLWAAVPIRPAHADLRLVTVVRGRTVATAWVHLR